MIQLKGGPQGKGLTQPNPFPPPSLPAYGKITPKISHWNSNIWKNKLAETSDSWELASTVGSTKYLHFIKIDVNAISWRRKKAFRYRHKREQVLGAKIMVYLGYDDMQLCKHLPNYTECQPWTIQRPLHEVVKASAVVTTYSIPQKL